MTPAQIRIVRRSFASIDGRRERLADLFFAHLFALDPELRRLFPGDLRRRGAKLVHAAGLIVEDLHRLTMFVPGLEALAVRYSSQGLEPAHYSAIGQALSLTVRALLGPGFTTEVEAALNHVYDELSAIMINAADRDYSLAA